MGETNRCKIKYIPSKLPVLHCLCILCVAFFCSIFLTACGLGQAKSAAILDCPYTSLGWESSLEDVITAEGDGFSTYDSVYGGLCYTYPKEYNGLQGTVKYMFDDKEKLVSVAWAYHTDDADALLTLYETICASVESSYGESGYHTGSVGNYGDVWYLESGDIILSSMSTDELMALQYSYLHPSVSNTEKTTQ